MSEVKKRGFFSRLFGFLDASRRVVLNIIFLFIVAALLFAVFDVRPSMPDGAALVVAPQGVVVDELSTVDLISELAGPSVPAETRLLDLIRAVDIASTDERIAMLVLNLDNMTHIGLSKAQELGAAIDRFRNTGKAVIASASFYNQDQYLLASYADQIFVNTMGGVALEGFAVYRNYFRSALEKLAINFHVFKVGDFKSALEPIMRDDMSAAARTANEQWLGRLWGLYRQQVIARRSISAENFDFYLNHIDQVLAQHRGDTAQAALEYGLVDGIISRPKFRDLLIELVGAGAEGEFNQVHHRDYLNIAQPMQLPKDETVGLIIASGNIVDGDQPAGVIGGDSLARLIRQARKDDSIKALVLRIDSGGGSAFASEVIREELLALQMAGKPLVVSMGSVAASGGYWIAAAADEVWATPATLTGSIGIFAAFPTFEKSLDKLGVTTDGVGTSAVAGKLRLDMPLEPALSRAMQLGIESGYRRFLDIVAQGRDLALNDVAKIAKGRVWSGADALSHGLVDQLGGLDNAMASAAALVGLAPADVRELRLPLSPEEEFMRLLSGVAALAPTLPVQLQSALQQLFPDWQQLLQLNDRQHIYAYCVSCTGP